MAKLYSNLTKIAKGSKAAAERALLATSADIVAMTKELSPVDTGALKRSYGAVPESSTVVHIGSDVDYAIYQEYGTSVMPAQPHLTPAFEQASVTFEHRLTDEIKRIT